MKIIIRIPIVLILVLVIIFAGCPTEEVESTISIQNLISNCVLNDLKWGEYSFSSIATGQTTEYIYLVAGEFEKNKVTFIMTANGQSVYLETVEEFAAEEGKNIKIILRDSTEVSNPIEE